MLRGHLSMWGGGGVFWGSDRRAMGGHLSTWGGAGELATMVLYSTCHFSALLIGHFAENFEDFVPFKKCERFV